MEAVEATPPSAEAGATPVRRDAPVRRTADAASPPRATPARTNRKVRSIWLKQLHTWHWVSAAISLTAMLLFSITGITLNHAATISAEPVVTQSSGQLPAPVLDALPPANDGSAPLPEEVAREVARVVTLNPAGFPADWTDEAEVYVAMPGPGRDAWVSIDRTSGEVSAEKTERGWISYFNDLHKGRNTGEAWFWFIDVFAVACVIFTVTGLLLLQLHARHRPSTWPLVGLSMAIPLVIAVFFIH